MKYKGVDVTYSHQGVGETVVLLHGFLEERTMWETVTDQLRQNHTVIAVDLLGHGDSDCLGYVHGMEEQAEAVKQVLDEEQIESCILVGHSMGGYVALALARKYPVLIKSLALFHSTALPDSKEKQQDRERVIDLVKRNQEIYINAAIPTLFAPANVGRCTDEINKVVSIAQGFSKRGIIANIRGMMQRKDCSDILKNGTFKKLIIQGTEDSVISNESIHSQVELNANIDLQIIEGIGHMGHIEAPAKCQEIIVDFCADTIG
ncbi:MAG: alpha/beta hydrolase [Flavobacteriales bacterium]|nr:alpha/beta hydrolase [Flavobacteriales bacterium]